MGATKCTLSAFFHIKKFNGRACARRVDGGLLDRLVHVDDGDEHTFYDREKEGRTILYSSNMWSYPIK